MALSIFDLDNTLIAGDSDFLWGEFLREEGIVAGSDHAARNAEFLRAYQDGTLDIEAYLRFAQAPLAGWRAGDLAGHQRRFVERKVEALLLPAAAALLDRERRRGRRLLIITATSEVIARPVAERLGVAELLGCETEFVDGRYTGRPTGVPTFGKGKVTRLESWLAEQGESLDGASFYSDSRNDLPLLSRVDHPVAVDPDPELRRVATERGWPIISLRG